MSWHHKKVLLAVTGSIAAYKSTFLVRLLVKNGAQVKVVLSPAARDFITPLTLATLSKNPVYWEYFDRTEDTGTWHNHVELGLWADVLLIAPATANTLAKMANAQADNFLMAVYLSAKCPVFFAPAMDFDMHRHPATQSNIARLHEMGNHHIPAETGELASGLEGEGRMAEPEHIVRYIENYWQAQSPFRGKRVLINGGPTHEPLDPVRFLGNRSSGKMAIALAEAAAAQGAEVDLVLGPTHLQPGDKAIRCHRVHTAREMLECCLALFSHSALTICSAAVADYRPREVAPEKIKKNTEHYTLELVKNPDILATLGQKKLAGQFLVGFALETQDAEKYGRQKRSAKNCDLIVVNQPGDHSGFGHDTNEAMLLGPAEYRHAVPLTTKEKLAYEILASCLSFMD